MEKVKAACIFFFPQFPPSGILMVAHSVRDYQSILCSWLKTLCI